MCYSFVVVELLEIFMYNFTKYCTFLILPKVPQCCYFAPPSVFTDIALNVSKQPIMFTTTRNGLIRQQAGTTPLALRWYISPV